MTAAFTIVAINYLAYAKTLADTLTKHNPDIELYICLIGNKDDIPAGNNIPYKIIDTHSSKMYGFSDMRSRYNNFELVCALKPFFAEHILQEIKPDILLYFDADIVVFNKVDVLLKTFESASIILTPHCVHVVPKNGNLSMEMNLLNYGLYNAGFFGVDRSENAFKFLRWFQEKMFLDCSEDLSKARYYDQIWLNLVPLYFEGVHILKDFGYNMAVWNMSERALSRTAEGTYLINDEVPLVFFHYSGYNPQNPDVLSKNHPIYTFLERPDVLPVFNEYKSLLEHNNLEFYKKVLVEDKVKVSEPIVQVSLKRRVFNKISKYLPANS